MSEVKTCGCYENGRQVNKLNTHSILLYCKTKVVKVYIVSGSQVVRVKGLAKAQENLWLV